MSDHYMTVFKSEDTVVRRAKEQIDEAEIGIEVACQIEQFERLKPNLKAAKERGVVIKIVVYCPNDPSELLEENLEPYASEVRACYIPGRSSPLSITRRRVIRQICGPANRSGSSSTIRSSRLSFTGSSRSASGRSGSRSSRVTIHRRRT
ncbi:hypothetical protein D8S78_07960 [Natrialba swarupiae]|nr:hypothetical protein [Natrialba swarupiae]